MWSINVPTTCLLGSGTTGKDSRFSVYNAKNVPIMADLFNVKTMSSLQIAELTGKAHSNVMRDIRNILEQLEDKHQFNFELMFRTNKLGNGAERKDPYYQLTKKDCLLLASGYDANLRAKIINRWEELESEKRNGGFQVPQSFAEALQLAANQAKQIEEQQKQIEQKEVEKQAIIEETKPAVVFTECVKNSPTNILVRDLAKLITQNGFKIGECRLYDWLVEKKYLIRHKRWSKSKGKYDNDYTPTQKAAEMFLFFVTENAVMQGGNLAFIKHTCYVTGKGQVYFLNKFKELSKAA